MATDPARLAYALRCNPFGARLTIFSYAHTPTPAQVEALQVDIPLLLVLLLTGQPNTHGAVWPRQVTASLCQNRPPMSNIHGENSDAQSYTWIVDLNKSS